MYLFLLRKALPFTLTFIFGALLSGLFGLSGSSEKKYGYVGGTRTYEFGGHCRMRRHTLVAESKPLNILYQPAAVMPLGIEPWKDGRPVVVRVTFGADSKVQGVKPVAGWLRVPNENLVEVKATWEAVTTAAQGIRFAPETINGIPVTVEREVEIIFSGD
jgi:hypothetical protein